MNANVEKMVATLASILYNQPAGTNLTVGNTTLTVKSFAGGHVQAIDVGPFRFVTQNPNKPSKWGKMAAKGHQIMWVIHQPDNQWVYRYVDGTVTEL